MAKLVNKDTKATIELTDTEQIRAYKNSGYEEVRVKPAKKGSTGEDAKKDAPEKQ